MSLGKYQQIQQFIRFKYSAIRELQTIPYIDIHSALRELPIMPYIEMHSALRELPTNSTIYYIEIQCPHGTAIAIHYIEMHSTLGELPTMCFIEKHSSLRELAIITYSGLRELLTTHHIEMHSAPGGNYNSNSLH